MHSNIPKITFFIRSNKDKEQTHSIYCRLVLNSRVSEFSIGEKISPNEWDQESQTFSGITSEKTEYINLLCDKIKYNLKTSILLLDKEKEVLHPKKVLEIYRNKKSPTVVIFDVIQKFIDWEVNEGELDSQTVAIHERYLVHLKEFAKQQKYFVTDFNEVEAEKFKDWFRLSRGTKNKTTASRHVSFYRNSLTWAVKKGIIKEHNLLYYKGERDKTKKPESITENDLLALMNYQFTSEMLNKIKDLFLFQIATGVSYGDLWNVFEVKDTQAGKIIVGQRNKGHGNSFFVPYDELAEAILLKYQYQLPKYCNGTYNRLLKEIAALVGIKTHLKSHTGRKTFASLKFSNGWTISTISLMLGHSNTKTTETYYVERNSGALISEMLLRTQTQIN